MLIFILLASISFDVMSITYDLVPVKCSVAVEKQINERSARTRASVRRWRAPAAFIHTSGPFGAELGRHINQTKDKNRYDSCVTTDMFWILCVAVLFYSEKEPQWF
ncbi:hypothetical protein SRHO_G00180050 [Serrasalmus rhombeus]